MRASVSGARPAVEPKLIHQRNVSAPWARESTRAARCRRWAKIAPPARRRPRPRDTKRAPSSCVLQLNKRGKQPFILFFGVAYAGSCAPVCVLRVCACAHVRDVCM